MHNNYDRLNLLFNQITHCIDSVSFFKNSHLNKVGIILMKKLSSVLFKSPKFINYNLFFVIYICKKIRELNGKKT